MLIHLRYPSFVDALRELDDALPIIFLFAHLPQQGQFNVSNASSDNDVLIITLSQESWLHQHNCPHM